MLDLLSNASNGVEEVTVAFTEYVGLLRGLVDAPQGGESKLRSVVTFKWTNSLGGRTPRCVCVCVCLGDLMACDLLSVFLQHTDRCMV